MNDMINDHSLLFSFLPGILESLRKPVVMCWLIWSSSIVTRALISNHIYINQKSLRSQGIYNPYVKAQARRHYFDIFILPLKVAKDKITFQWIGGMHGKLSTWNILIAFYVWQQIYVNDFYLATVQPSFGRSWWRHQVETFSALLALCAGNSPASGEFPAQKPVTRSFDVFFDLCLNKRLRKQSRGWWFETLSCPLFRHRNVITRFFYYFSFVYGDWMSDSDLFVRSCKHISRIALLGSVNITYLKMLETYAYDVGVCNAVMLFDIVILSPYWPISYFLW